MSEYAKIPIGQEAESLDVSPRFDGYSGIEVINDDGTSFFVGKHTNRVLTIHGITEDQANNILTELKKAAFQYQPHETQGALLNPAAELGDGVTVNSTYSGIYKMEKRFTPKMDTDISAPYDEEIDHEYPYQPKQDRVYQRAIAENKSQISLTQEQISVEVSRAKGAEVELSSAITSTAETITAKVNKKVTSDTGETSRETFGWNLTSNSWTLYSGGKTVFKATKDGVEVTGKITASTGKIGGFTIGSNSITTNEQTWNGHTTGIYIGNNGIQLGSLDGSYFWASKSGNVVAKNMSLTGTLKIAGTEIDASKLRIGAQSSYDNRSTWSTGAGYGYNDNAATTQGTTSYPSVFRCGTLTTNTITITQSWLTMDGKYGQWKTATIGGVTINYLGY